MLFFTAPPVAVDDAGGGAAGKAGGVRGHSLRYLAEKARRGDALAQKRKARDEVLASAEREAKRTRLAAEVQGGQELERLKRDALRALEQQLAQHAVLDELDDEHLGRWSEAQATAAEQADMVEAGRRRREEVEGKVLGGGGVFGDDWDNGVVV